MMNQSLTPIITGGKRSLEDNKDEREKLNTLFTDRPEDFLSEVLFLSLGCINQQIDYGETNSGGVSPSSHILSFINDEIEFREAVAAIPPVLVPEINKIKFGVTGLKTKKDERGIKKYRRINELGACHSVRIALIASQL
jgi:hypothetical protein